MIPSSRDSDAPAPAAPSDNSSGGDWFHLDSSSDDPNRRGSKTAVPMDKPGCPALPGYDILGELGRGNTCVVFKARHLALKRNVELKIFLFEPGDADGRDRFHRAAAAAQLQHPNIAPIYEIGDLDGRPYLVQDYHDAGSLRKWLSRTPPSPHQAAAVLESLARAVQFAHDRGIRHRDLKPGNIVLASLAPAAGDGEAKADHSAATTSVPAGEILGFVPKIAGFGLAEHLPGRGTSVPGTPQYMAPEQARGNAKAHAPAPDIYSLGAILYEMLTGRPPFDGVSAAETIFLLQAHEPIPPRWFRPSIPKDLETICLKCLEKQPQRRYAQAGALADDLRQFLNDRPIHARPPGPFERCRRWFKWQRA